MLVCCIWDKIIIHYVYDKHTVCVEGLLVLFLLTSSFHTMQVIRSIFTLYRHISRRRCYKAFVPLIFIRYMFPRIIDITEIHSDNTPLFPSPNTNRATHLHLQRSSPPSLQDTTNSMLRQTAQRITQRAGSRGFSVLTASEEFPGYELLS